MDNNLPFAVLSHQKTERARLRGKRKRESPVEKQNKNAQQGAKYATQSI